MRLPGCHGAVVSVYVWQQELEPGFPLALLEYVVRGDRDPMHWHDHFEIALVLEGRGRFMFGRRAQKAAFGQGEVVVSGQVEPDTYILTKAGPTLTQIRVGTQSFKLVRGTDGHDQRVDMAPESGSRRVLSDDEAVALAQRIVDDADKGRVGLTDLGRRARHLLEATTESGDVDPRF